MALVTDLFADHSRIWQDNHYVYPVISRRSRGLSLGINLNPDTACNFDCVYCCVDRATPPRTKSVDLDRLRRELEAILKPTANGDLFRAPPFDRTPEPLRRLNDIAFSGDGEPTTYPRFAEACRLVTELRTWHGLDCKIVVITNATVLARPGVEEGLAHLDAHGGEVWAKLDAGTQAWYAAVDRSDVPLDRVLANILACGRKRALCIQALFCRLHGEAPPAAELDAWADRLRDLRDGGCQIRQVQVYTTARATAESWVTALNTAELEAIAQRARDLGLEAESYPGQY